MYDWSADAKTTWPMPNGWIGSSFIACKDSAKSCAPTFEWKVHAMAGGVTVTRFRHRGQVITCWTWSAKVTTHSRRRRPTEAELSLHVFGAFLTKTFWSTFFWRFDLRFFFVWVFSSLPNEVWSRLPATRPRPHWTLLLRLWPRPRRRTRCHGETVWPCAPTYASHRRVDGDKKWYETILKWTVMIRSTR